MTDTTTTDAAVNELAKKYKQWMVGANRRRPLMPQNAFKEGSDRNYDLKNLLERKFLHWEHQSWGMNIGWTDDASPTTDAKASRWFFARPGGTLQQIKYAEPIAIGYGTEPSFLRHQSQTFGVNLAWVKEPAFEWRLLGGIAGQPVECGDWLAIHNAKAGSADVPGLLIDFDRSVGGDIGWPDSQTWLEEGMGELVGLAKDAAMKLIMAKLGGA